MKIETLEILAKDLKPVSGSVKEYRKNPSDINCALYAAVHYAVKNNGTMLVTEGNSFMNKVYHISVYNKENLNKFAPLAVKVFIAYLVYTNGNIEKIQVEK